DDAYTQDRAHPMIDPSLRVNMVKEAAKSPDTAVILLDHVIGYGGHDDMAGVFAPVINVAKEERTFITIASVTGTQEDPQNYQDQINKLEDAGVIITSSNAQAAKLAADIITYLNREEIVNEDTEKEKEEGNFTDKKNLIASKPYIINIGLSKCADAISNQGGKVFQYLWALI